MSILKKTITYRIGAILITAITGIILGLSIEFSTAIGVLIEILHTFYYYIHETIWNRIEKTRFK